MYAYPRPLDLAYPAGVLSSEGRFMRRSEVGQSESWPEGQPEGRCGAWGRASQALTRETRGFRPALERGSATVSWLDGDRRAARKRRAQGPLRGSAKSPEERTRVLRRRGGTLRGVAVCLCFPKAGSKPRPLPRCAFRRSVSPQGGEKKIKAQLARRCENASAWLFESMQRKIQTTRQTALL